MMEISFIFSIAILTMSVVAHEVSHGITAYALGDPTAKYAGRLTLNPIKHLDLFGSIIIPAFTYLLGGFIFGWAKPVPYNPYNLRNQKWGPAFVGIAGPLSNILLATVFALSIRFGQGIFPSELSERFIGIAGLIVLTNLVLAIFNLIPIPPLDGSKLLFAVLPYKLRNVESFLESYGFIIFLIFLTFFWHLMLPIIFILFKFLAGFSL